MTGEIANLPIVHASMDISVLPHSAPMFFKHNQNFDHEATTKMELQKDKLR